MASLYGDANWSNNDLNAVLESVKKEISKSVFSIFSIEQLRHYKEKMEEREKEGHLVSLVDMWGLAIEYLIQGKVLNTLDITEAKYILSKNKYKYISPSETSEIIFFFRKQWVHYLTSRWHYQRARTLFPSTQLSTWRMARQDVP